MKEENKNVTPNREDSVAAAVMTALRETVSGKGMVALDRDDVERVLQVGRPVSYLMATGSGAEALGDALRGLEREARRQGVDLFSLRDMALCIDAGSRRPDGTTGEGHFAMAQMDVLSGFMNRFGDDFNIVWGLYSSPAVAEHSIRVVLIGC